VSEEEKKREHEMRGANNRITQITHTVGFGPKVLKQLTESKSMV
jgi:hypothetical protein